MPFVGTGHVWILAILLVVVLIVWGPGKLPDVGSGMGRAIREFRKASSDTKEEFAQGNARAPCRRCDAHRAGDSDRRPRCLRLSRRRSHPVAE